MPVRYTYSATGVDPTVLFELAMKGMYTENLELGSQIAASLKLSGNIVNQLLNEAKERKFWETHDSTDYLDWSKAKNVRFPNLKLSTTSISLRLPVSLLTEIKIAANKRDVPYQSLIKMWLAEKVG